MHKIIQYRIEYTLARMHMQARSYIIGIIEMYRISANTTEQKGYS